MTVYTAVPTVATGDMWTAANHNTYVRDNLAFFKSDFVVHGQVQALGQFDTTSVTYVDITGASVSLVLTVPSLVFLTASGIIKADQSAYTAFLQGVIDGTEAGDGRIRKDGADGIVWSAFGYTYYKTAVQAGTRVCKLQLMTSNALMTARVFGINLVALAIAN